MMKKTITIAYLLLCGLAGTEVATAGGKTNACTPPEGKIDIEPSQKCNGKYTVAIGKDLILKAVSLKDKDCYCGRGVQDTIDTTEGVKWSVGGGAIGTLVGGEMQTPKTYTAPDTTHTNVAVRLQVDDKAEGPETTDDGGFVEVSSLNLDVVTPNRVATTNVNNVGCSGLTPYGKKEKLTDQVSRQGCAVDFEGLSIFEVYGGCTFVQNDCDMPPIGGGTPKGAINSENKVIDLDTHQACLTQDFQIKPDACISKNRCEWKVTPNGKWTPELPYFHRDYVFHFTDGSVTSLVLSRENITYP